MSNIKHIKVGEETYNIDAQNNIVVSMTEPQGEDRLTHWIKYSGIRNLRYGVKFQTTVTDGNTKYYVIDDEGALTLSDSTSSSIKFATKMLGLFKDKQYSIYTTNNWSNSSNYDVDIYFYDVNKAFVSKLTATIEGGSHSAKTLVQTFTLPETARYVRFGLTTNYSEQLALTQEGVDLDELTSDEYRYGNSSGTDIQLFELDDDHYVEV